ncbi:MAG TPA: PDZ domain-containing protein, partial [Thermoanaerobaculia bacterium]|nr:PDZ domain-containing protein [Thermoanaerobaculia bacterium]
AHGRLVRPTLGVELVQDQLVQRWGLQGALVGSVVRGSGAAEAGLRPTTQDRYGRVRLGDLIVALEGDAVVSSSDVFLALERRRAGEVVTVTVERDGERVDLEVELGEAVR